MFGGGGVCEQNKEINLHVHVLTTLKNSIIILKLQEMVIQLFTNCICIYLEQFDPSRERFQSHLTITDENHGHINHTPGFCIEIVHFMNCFLPMTAMSCRRWLTSRRRKSATKESNEEMPSGWRNWKHKSTLVILQSVFNTQLRMENPI